MRFPERFSNLPEYAFPRLRALLDHHPAGGEVVHMSIGEPKHAFPPFVADVLSQNINGFNRYPANNGDAELLGACSDWIQRRYSVEVDPDTQVLSLNGTREGLFAASVALSPESKGGQRPKILIPNPFYQVYAIGALTSGADPYFVPALAQNGFLPDYHSLPPEVLNATTAAYICSPSNPQGAVASVEYWINLIQLAEKYDFQIFADECYAEIYRGAPPTGALEAAAKVSVDPERVVVFHSLSKRSNLPGLRSGFVAGGPKSIAEMKKLRAYAGAPIPTPLQQVSAACWRDDTHVVENRLLYQEKYEAADQIFKGVQGFLSPQAGFFLWLPVDDGEAATLKLWTQTGVRALPGAYLSRDVDGSNPGQGFIRAAMVASKQETIVGLQAIRDCLY